MKQLFLFNTSSIAAAYGVGTYIRQLTNCLTFSEIELNVVHLRSNTKEMTIETENGVRFFNIPTPAYRDTENPSRNELCFYRSVTYLLRPYVSRSDRAIFHLNFMNDGVLCEQLRKAFNGIIVLTVHYMEWAFSLYGNKDRFLEVVKKTENQIETAEEKNIHQNKRGTERLLNNCERIIAVARHEWNTLQEVYQIPGSKISVISNALKDTCCISSEKEKEELRRRLYIRSGEKIILFVGRLDKMKGFPILLKAFEQPLAYDENVRLLVAGDGNFQEQFSRIDGFWAKVSFTGFLKREQLFDLYKIADIGVIPSMYEEFGFVAIEMMMHELPVIANKTTGLNEIVDHGNTGLHVRLSEDDKQLAASADLLTDKIKRLLDNPKLRQKMGENGRQKFLERYEEQLFRKNMIEFYRSLFTKPKNNESDESTCQLSRQHSRPNEQLRELADRMIQEGERTNCPGLWYGKSGIAIFLFHYAQYTHNRHYEEKAFELFHTVTKAAKADLPLTYGSGLSGIGCAILYLQQEQLIPSNRTAFITEIETRMERRCIHSHPGFLNVDNDIISCGRYWEASIRTVQKQDSLETLRRKCTLIHLLSLLQRFTYPTAVHDRDNLLDFLARCYLLDLCNTKVEKLISRFSGYTVTAFDVKRAECGYHKTQFCYDPSQIGLKNGAAGQGLFLLQQLNGISADWQLLL